MPAGQRLGQLAGQLQLVLARVLQRSPEVCERSKSTLAAQRSAGHVDR